MAVLPQTSLARVGLGIDIVAVTAYVAVFAFAEQSIDGPAEPVLGWGPPVLAMVIAAVLALVAIARYDERSLLGWFAMIPGAFFLCLLAGEVVGLME